MWSHLAFFKGHPGCQGVHVTVQGGGAVSAAPGWVLALLGDLGQSLASGFTLLRREIGDHSVYISELL